VYSVNHWEQDSGIEWHPSTYYPGHQFVDVLGVDTYLQYGHNFDQYVHDTLLQIGEQRPIAITENGQMPDLVALRSSQPRWVYWTTWFGDESTSSQELYRDNYVMLEPYVVTQNETFQPVTDSLTAQVPVEDFSVPPTGAENDSGETVLLTGTPGDTQIQLSWDAVPDVPWYNVWFGTTPSSLAWLQGTSDTQYTVSPLGNGSTYYFAVTTYIDDVNGPFSNVVELVPVAPDAQGAEADPTTDPDLVIALSATPGINEVQLDWQALPGVGWYNVWFGTEEGSLEFLEGTGSNSFTATQLSAGVPYYFAVTPYIDDADGPFSNIIEIVLQ